MPEKEARKNIVRFFDPILHRNGFGITLMVYGDPKEHLTLIRRKENDGIGSFALSVAPDGEMQKLTIDQFCILVNRIIEEGILKKFIFAGGCLCFLRFNQDESKECKWTISIYDVIDQMNRIIEFLHEKLPWQEVRDLVWQNINI